MLAPAQLLAAALAAVALIAAAFADLRSYQIPNRYAVAIMLAFLGFSVGNGLHEAAVALAVGAGVFVVGTACFAKSWLGGGDVKLLVALALWVPPPLLPAFALVTSLAGASLSLVMLTPLRRALPAPPAPLARAETLRQPIPFAIAIAVGGLFVLVERVTG